jgi:hypothetical protein
MADPSDWERIVDNFFIGFVNRLDVCNPSNIQNIERYEQTRLDCKLVFDEFMPPLERLVQQFDTPPPNTDTDTIRIPLLEQLILRIEEIMHSTVFANIHETNQRAQPELGIRGHQGRSEFSLPNRFYDLQELRTRLIESRDVLIERRDVPTGIISNGDPNGGPNGGPDGDPDGGPNGGRKKRRKSMKKKRSFKKKKNTKKRRRMY